MTKAVVPKSMLARRVMVISSLSCAIYVASILSPCPAQRTIPVVMEVTTAAELTAALQDAVEGDVIHLTANITTSASLTINSTGVALAQSQGDTYVLTTNLVVNPGAKLTLRNLILDALDAGSPVVQVDAGAEAEVFGCRFEGTSAGSGMEIVGKATIEGCEFTDLEEGVRFGTDDHGAEDGCSIQWSYLDTCQSPMIVKDAGVLIKNNLITDTGSGDLDSAAIEVDAGSSAVEISHNTIVNSGGYGIRCIGGTDDSVQVKNNILATGYNYGVAEVPQGIGAIQNDYNDVYNFLRTAFGPGLAPGPNSLNKGDSRWFGVNPRFRAGSQFQLDDDSPCIGIGEDGSDIGHFGPMPPPNVQAENNGAPFAELDFLPKLWPNPDTDLVLSWGEPEDYAQGMPTGYQYSVDGGLYQPVPVDSPPLTVYTSAGDDGPHVVAVRAFREGSTFYGQPAYFVFAKHTAPPEIVLEGEVSLTLECGTEYVEPGYTATDLLEGDLTADVVVTGSVDHTMVGTYTLHYNVSDSRGNPAEEKARTVTVQDTTPPEIVLEGEVSLTLECGTEYVEPGFTATDVCDGDLTAQVAVTGSVDHMSVGTYTLHYNVSDAQGNPAEEKTRTVTVQDTAPPEIVLEGDNPLILECGTDYVEPGFTATDVCDGDLTAQVAVTGSVDEMSVGTYTLHYNVSDGQGNPAEEKLRTVTVEDTSPPEIVLEGDNPLILECGRGYVEPGFTATDVCDGDLTAQVAVTGSVDDMSVGAYTLHYNVSDGQGNPAEEKVRTVTVQDTTPPVITLIGDNPLILECGIEYVEPGFTATDVCDGDLTTQVAADGSVDPMTVGSYILTYNVSDAQGNPAEERTRTVAVVEGPLYIEEITETPQGAVSITWSSCLGVTYTIWSCLDLEAGQWSEEETIPSQGMSTTWEDIDPASVQKFYKIERVKVQ